MKRIGIFCLFSLVLISSFAAFPVETKEFVLNDPEKFKLDTLGVIVGILTFWLLPYSLLLLFIRKKNFRGSLAWGWLAGLVLVIILVIVIELVPSGGLLIY